MFSWLKKLFASPIVGLGDIQAAGKAWRERVKQTRLNGVPVGIRLVEVRNVHEDLENWDMCCDATLEVTRPDRTTYQRDVKLSIRNKFASRLKAGEVRPGKMDAQDETFFLIDWGDGSFDPVVLEVGSVGKIG